MQFMCLLHCNTHLGVAFIGLVAEDLTHAFDGNREWDDSVLIAGSTTLVRPVTTLHTEHQITRLTEQQLLGSCGNIYEQNGNNWRLWQI